MDDLFYYPIGVIPVCVGMAVSLRDGFAVPGCGPLIGVVVSIDDSDPWHVFAAIRYRGTLRTPYCITDCRRRLRLGSHMSVVDGTLIPTGSRGDNVAIGMGIWDGVPSFILPGDF